MTGIPGIYGDDLSEPAKAAHGRWVMALFDWCGHIDICPFGCVVDGFMCQEGQRFGAAERRRHREWRAVRDAEVTP